MDILVSTPIGLPALAAVLVLIPGARARELVVRASAILLGASALILAWRAGFAHSFPSLWGASLGQAIAMLDLALLAGVVLAALVRMKDGVSGVLAVVQGVGLFFLERPGGDASARAWPGLAVTPLSLVLVLVVSLVGALAVVLALGILPGRERRQGLAKTRQPRFFFFLLFSLSAANGLMLSDNLLWFHLFWNVATVCTAALMAHDGDEAARQNAFKALRINLGAGVALTLALVLLHWAGQPLSLAELARPGAATVSLLLPLFLLCAAGLAASAQAPFQGWLCGAASAPAPALALVHCAGLAPAGVCLVLRLCPAFQGVMLSGLIALAGAFTFLAASALAVGQSDAGRVLACTTSAALGLVLACAGINTPAAITAGLVILVFHAVSKALLFACLAVTEEKTGLRDVADMGRLFATLPKTALATLVGVCSMFLPPFGLALGMWMALEAATGARFLPVVLLLALGFGLWTLLWTRWAGVLLRSLRLGDAPAEDLAGAVRFVLAILAAGAAILPLCSPPLYKGLLEPAVRASHKAVGYVLHAFNFVGDQGVFPVYPLFVVLGIGAFFAWRATSVRPYGPGGSPHPDHAASPEEAACLDVPFALDGFFEESRLTNPINTVGLVLLAVMLGAVWGGLA